MARMAQAESARVQAAHVRLDVLADARTTGSVQNMLDRRHDLYHVQWKPRRRAVKGAKAR